MGTDLLSRLGTQVLKCTPNYNSTDGSWVCENDLKDLKLIFVFSVVIMLFRVVLYTNVLPFLTSGINLPLKKRIRCHDDIWFFLAHLCTFSLGLYTVTGESYAKAVLGSRDAMLLFWRSYPAQHVLMKPATALFYVFSMSVWFHNLVDLLLERVFGFRYLYYIAKMIQIPTNKKCLELMPSESTRGDFLSMILHHIVTSCLLVLSYYSSFTRIGHVILIVSDVSDVLLNITKVFYRMKKKRTSDVFFLTFILSWIYTRHLVYCMSLISNALDSTTELVDTCSSWDPAGYECYAGIAIYFSSVLCFTVLQALFIRWFILIAKTAYNSLRPGDTDVLDDDDCPPNCPSVTSQDTKSAHLALNETQKSG